MPRIFALVSVATVAILAGCASAPAPVFIERDPVDGLIAQNAAAATQALRELSEAAGNSRVVNAGRAAAKPLAPTGAAQSAAPPLSMAPEAEVMPAPQTIPVAAMPERRPPANTIASRVGSIAVEVEAPTPSTVIANSSGVVASGGLLSVPPPGLERLITVKWTGELEELLVRVAHESGWKLGARTGLRVAPVIISISAENRSTFDVLRDIGAIAGTSADILVSAPAKTISVRYPQR